MPPDPGYPGMPGPAPYPEAGRYDQATAAADPATRAGLVAGVLRRLPDGVAAAGACETRELEIALANTRGVRAAGATTAASFSILADAGSGTGWAEGTESALADLDVAALGERAARKAVDSREPARARLPAPTRWCWSPTRPRSWSSGWAGSASGPRPTTRAAASWSAGSASGSARPWSRSSTTPPPPTPSASASTSRASPSGG